MANSLYGKALQYYSFPSIVSDTVKAVLVKTGVGHYVVDLASDRYLSAIASGDRVATSAALTGKTFVNGLFVADNLTYGVLVASDPCGALVLFHDTGDAATSELILYLDTYQGLPVTPDGLHEVPIVWPTAGIFLL